MNSTHLSNRLNKVAEYIIQHGEKPIRLADIGTDHAYLPVNLTLNHNIQFAVAGDVVEGPYLSALNEVASHNLFDQINVRKANGLEAISTQDQINVISICGMGGKLISEILNSGINKIEDNCTLVLQSNTGGHLVRQWLNDHHMDIVDETVILEDQHYYEIIVAKRLQKSKKTLTPSQILMGPINLIKREEDFVKLWKSQYQHYAGILANITPDKADNNDKIKQIQNNLDLIKEVISIESN